MEGGIKLASAGAILAIMKGGILMLCSPCMLANITSVCERKREGEEEHVHI